MDTPCVNVCTTDEASGLCAGCGRSLAEIAAWPHLTVEQRRRIMRALAGGRSNSRGRERS